MAKAVINKVAKFCKKDNANNDKEWLENLEAFYSEGKKRMLKVQQGIESNGHIKVGDKKDFPDDVQLVSLTEVLNYLSIGIMYKEMPDFTRKPLKRRALFQVRM